MKVQITRPITFPKEGEMWKPSIIAIHKIPHEMKDVKVSEEMGYTAVVSHKYYVIINLWLVVIDFSLIIKSKDNQ